MKRTLSLIISLALTMTFVTHGQIAHAETGLEPPKSEWTWCSGTVVNGCIESVTTIDPAGTETIYTTQVSLPASLTISIKCGVDPSYLSCNGNKFVSSGTGPCKEDPNFGSHAGLPALELDIAWPTKIGWKVKVKISMGNFRPGFTIGHGTRSALVADDGDGTFTYTHLSEIETVYSASPPGNIGMPGSSTWLSWFETAVANNQSDTVHVQIWPRDHLINASLSSTGCKYYPFLDAWAEANAQGFSWSYSAGATSTIPNILKFSANAPHYKPQVGSNPLEVLNARVQVFMPTTFFSALGYASVDEVDTTKFTVTTEDGQSTTPSIIKQDGGLVINLGVQHYSAPNPSITFKSKNSAVTSTTTSTSSTPMLVKTLTRKSSISLTKVLAYTGTGTKSWAASGGCTISSGKLRAPNKKTTCKVTLTVRNSKKKIVATKRTTITVN